MGTAKLEIDDVGPELRSVLRALRRYLGGRFPHPDLLKQMPRDSLQVVPQHLVNVQHVRGLREPFNVQIDGERIKASWRFKGGHFGALIEACDGE